MKEEETRSRPRVLFALDERGGRRIGIDRRRFSYETHIPERRTGKDRRSGEDRRKHPYSPREPKPNIIAERKEDLP